MADKKYYRSKNGFTGKIYDAQVRVSKQRNQPLPNYSKEELRHWLYSQPNFDFLYCNWCASGYQKDLAPSVDRDNDYKGYTMSNLKRLCTFKENRERLYADKLNGINTKQSKSVSQWSTEGQFIKEYYSIAEAARTTGISEAWISIVSRVKNKTGGGYRWILTGKE